MSCNIYNNVSLLKAAPLFYHYYMIRFPNEDAFPNRKALKHVGYPVRPQLRLWRVIFILAWTFSMDGCLTTDTVATL